jgi:hypothetical protein
MRPGCRQVKYSTKLPSLGCGGLQHPERAPEMNDTDARLWHARLRVNRIALHSRS